MSLSYDTLQLLLSEAQKAMEGWRQRFPYAPIGSKDDEKSRTRTCSLLLTIALLGCLALLWGSKRGVDEGQALTWSEVLVAREPGPHSEPLVQPLTRSSKDGLLETQLSITTARVSLGPLQYMTRLYEGLFPGPTLRVLPGDRIELDLINELEDPESCFPENAFACPNITNLHVHGMHVDPTGNADNIYRRAGPGESLHYTYHVPSNHYEGLFYYHPHNAGSSTVQDLSGMSGAIVVEDPPESPLASFRDIIMVLQEIDLTKLESNPYGSTLPLLQVDQVHDTGFPFMAVNGQFQPVLAVNPGERARLRLLHAGVSAYLSLSLEGCEMTTVARDGVLLATPRPSETILLVPGSRAEVLVSCPSEGTFVLEAGRKDDKAALQAAVGSRTKLVPAGSVAFIHATGETVVGNAVPPVLRDSSGLLANFNDYDSEDEGEPLGKFVLAFNEGPKVVRGDGTYSWYGINGKEFSLEEVQRRAKLGSVEEWVIVNKEGNANHPFHLHVNHFQVVGFSCVGQGVSPQQCISPPGDWHIGDWRDTISIAAAGNVTIRWKADDFPGKSLAHCHIFSHEDTGMAMNFVIY